MYSKCWLITIVCFTVVELFLANDENQYVEIELSP